MAIVIFFVIIDMMYMATGLIAFSIMCVVSYLVYLKYGGKEESVAKDVGKAGSSEKEVDN